MTRKLKSSRKPPPPKRQPAKWQRERHISLLLWILIPLTILIAVALVGYWAYDTYVAVWNQPVSKINGTTLDERQFVRMLRFNMFNKIVTGETPDMATLPYEVLHEMEDGELVRQETSALNIDVASGNVTEEIRRITGVYPPNDMGLGNATQAGQYQRFLDAVQLSNDEHRRIVETGLLEVELRNHFKEEVPAEAKHVHLYVLPRDTEEKALAALEQLNDGNVTTTQELLEGDRGWVPEGIHPEFDNTAFTLEAGNTSQPIQTAQGYSLIKVSEIDENRAIVDDHREILGTSAFDTWHDQARREKVVSYIDDDKIRWAIDHID